MKGGGSMTVQMIYFTCIGGGIILLACSLVFGTIGDALDFGGLELFSIDIGDADIDILPISLRSLCLAATVFGSLSIMLLQQPMWMRHLIAGVAAYVGALLVQNFTFFLKDHQSEADSMESICSRDYVVNIAIPENGFGSVASVDRERSVITLTARSAEGIALPVGTPVDVVKLSENVAIVMKR